MRLLALSDLHVQHAENRRTLEALPDHPEDWLILAGDLGERAEQLRWVFETLGPRFARLIWVPGNHELWTVRGESRRGEALYQGLVDVCREHDVLTPEDPWPMWPGEGPPTVIVPMFLLYDYSFCPPGMGPEEAVAWAADGGIVCADERFLDPAPWPSRQAWCHARLEATERRLAALPGDHRTVLINHWPLRLDLCRLFRIPRFTPWCGTRRTEDWHTTWRARAVVSGHLHMRATDWRDGVRFEEVSLGYPRHWRSERGASGYLREILPGPPDPPALRDAGPRWHR